MSNQRFLNFRAISFGLAVLIAGGCATTVPYTGIGRYPQLERGAPIPPVDFLGNVLSVPIKLLLWNWRVNSHSISQQTEDKLIEYLEARDLPLIDDAKFQLNEYNPGADLSRLAKNRHIAWPYRAFIGFPVTLVFDVLLPGRIFPWGDHYNPYTNTVHLYSDHPAIALHEAGHVQDFSRRRHKGTYAFIRLIPFVDLYQEYRATNEAIKYLQETKDTTTELSAYKILYPAYGTYVGGYLFPPIGTVGGALLGHAAGRSAVALRTHGLKHPAAAPSTPPPSAAPPPQQIEAQPTPSGTP